MKGLKDGFTGERSIVLPQMIVEMEERDPLVSSLYITDIGYYPKASHHFRERTVPVISASPAVYFSALAYPPTLTPKMVKATEPSRTRQIMSATVKIVDFFIDFPRTLCYTIK